MSLPVDHRDFNFPPLSESDMLPDPFALFNAWVEGAQRAKVLDWDAVTVATATPDGRPSARVVFLRGADETGFTFYTNYESRKGRQLAENDRAAMVFHWREVERQICIEGTVMRVSTAESDAYYAGRPVQSQLGAWASSQSEPLDDAATLERRVAELRKRFGDGPIPRPSHWGGYRLSPDRMEFWQGRPSRLHDRFVYTLQNDGSWSRQRLNP